MTSAKVWFITGASRGFGHLWADAAAQRGDKIAVTARNLSALDPLVARYGDAVLPLALDVTDRPAVFAAVARAHAHFGRLDVVLANAGYGLVGAVEELEIDAVRAQIETNVIGTLSLIQAALPLLRAQGSGHILPVASVAGLVGFPTGGLYSASKFAVVAMAEALAGEVAPLGLKVTVIEPGPFATDFMGTSLQAAKPIAAYDPVRQAIETSLDPASFLPPETTVAPLLRVIDAGRPPLHLMLGTLRALVDATYAARVADWDNWAGAKTA
jgi:NAD(P)-dependent dehydrogenase (short-subunit alcohol dehydrogenase family)